MGFRAVVLATFVVVGFFKNPSFLSFLPVDAGILLALVVIGCGLYSLIQSRFKVPQAVLWIWLLFALFAVPVAWTTWTPYSSDKVLHLFTMTFEAAMLPLFIVRDTRDLGRFVTALAALGYAVILSSVYTLVTADPSHPADRLTAAVASTLALGRYAGIAGIWALCLGLDRKVSLLTMSLLLAPIPAVMFFSGQRGPILGLSVTTALVLALFYRKRLGTLVQFAVVGAAAALILSYSGTIAPTSSASRVEGVIAGRVDPSVRFRPLAAEASIREIVQNPLGTGWGGFITIMRHPETWPDEYDVYPHNLWLEVLLEAGWIPGTFFIGLFLNGLWQTYKRASNSGETQFKVLFGLLIYQAINASVSGDITYNSFLACYGLSLISATLPSVWGHPRQADAPRGLMQPMPQPSSPI